jgi:hypothetical protein
MREITQDECLAIQGGASLWKAIWAGAFGGLLGAVMGIPGGPMGMIVGAGTVGTEWFLGGLMVTGTCETVMLAGGRCPEDLY